MHNDSMGPNNVDAMRAGLMRDRHASMQMPPPFTFHDQRVASTANYDVDLNLVATNISELARYIYGLQGHYSKERDTIFAQNIFHKEMAIYKHLYLSPQASEVTKQLDVFIFEELKEYPSLLLAYQEYVKHKLESSPFVFNIKNYLNKGKIRSFAKEKVESNSASNSEHGSEVQKNEQTVFSNEKLTELVFEMATAIDGLRAEVRNLVAKTMPMGGRY